GSRGAIGLYRLQQIRDSRRGVFREIQLVLGVPTTHTNDVLRMAHQRMDHAGMPGLLYAYETFMPKAFQQSAAMLVAVEAWEPCHNWNLPVPIHLCSPAGWIPRDYVLVALVYLCRNGGGDGAFRVHMGSAVRSHAPAARGTRRSPGMNGVSTASRRSATTL